MTIFGLVVGREWILQSTNGGNGSKVDGIHIPTHNLFNMPILSTQPYKGTRDFYPEDMQRRNYIFGLWRKVLLQHGYQEYDASVIENAEIYLAKSGEELGSKQLYSFVDKGDRSIALRPEMTPTLARIVSAKFNELKFPLRWFSVPNCFRYERPQKGRLREFYQLNVDIIGKPAGEVDLEVLYLVGKLFLEFKADKSMFKIMFNHRQVLDLWLEEYSLLESKELIYTVLDNWFKLTVEQNSVKLSEKLNPEEISNIVALCTKSGEQWSKYLELTHSFAEIKNILELLPQILPEVEYEFSPTIIRGLAYYTGLVFEGFNKNPVSPRAMFGAGRYDDLLDLFGQKSPAIGVGVGDVTWADFLTDWDLWPENFGSMSRTGIMLLDPQNLSKVYAQIIPDIITNNGCYEIDTDYSRSENKRYETLKKRGCDTVLKV